MKVLTACWVSTWPWPRPRARVPGETLTLCSTGGMRAHAANERVANCTGRDFGWEIAHAAVTRRPPISLDTMVPRTGGYTHAAGVGICPSFKGHCLSRRAKP